MSLTKQQSEWWDERLHNWGIWASSKDGVGKVKISSAYRLAAPGRRGDDDGIPADVAGAWDTNALWLKLQPKHRTVVHLRYATTMSDGDSARAMSIDRTTFVHYVRHAKEALHVLHIVSRGANRISSKPPTLHAVSRHAGVSHQERD
jgi:hypothetical protein